MHQLSATLVLSVSARSDLFSHAAICQLGSFAPQSSHRSCNKLTHSHPLISDHSSTLSTFKLLCESTTPSSPRLAALSPRLPFRHTLPPKPSCTNMTRLLFNPILLCYSCASAWSCMSNWTFQWFEKLQAASFGISQGNASSDIRPQRHDASKQQV